MLNLRNMPYVSGRILSWHEDIMPVAKAWLSNITFERQGKSVLYRSFALDKTGVLLNVL